MTRSPIAQRVRIGIVLPQDRAQSVRLTIPDLPYLLNDTPLRATTLTVRVDADRIRCSPGAHPRAAGFIPRGRPRAMNPAARTVLTPARGFDSDRDGVTLHDAIAGRGFHWSKRIDMTLPDRIELSVKDGHLLIVNELPVETYLKGVITAEMSGLAPIEFLKAQCIVARSWMRAATERKHADLGIDYCNDDCCQRFQGVGTLTEAARAAVDQTAGRIMIHESGTLVDANYSKSCGGIVEAPEHVWGIPKPGLHSLIDAPDGSSVGKFIPVEANNIADYTGGPWLADCDAYCSPNVVPESDLPQYLGRVDDGGGHFRWHVSYAVEQIEDLLQRKFFNRVNSVNGVAHRFSGGGHEEKSKVESRKSKASRVAHRFSGGGHEEKSKVESRKSKASRVAHRFSGGGHEEKSKVESRKSKASRVAHRFSGGGHEEKLKVESRKSKASRVAHRFSGGGHESVDGSSPPPLKRWATQSGGERTAPLGRLHDLVVTRCGRSGRATQLRIAYDDPNNNRQTATIDDQYWIRHALHESFLFSSAFDIRIERDDAGWPKTVNLYGAGWGHGAGMCQIGALGMALHGADHQRILNHYFQDIRIEKTHA